MIIAGFIVKTWKGIVTVIPVTFALIVFASAIASRVALFDKSEPSVGMRICLYIDPILLERRWSAIVTS